MTNHAAFPSSQDTDPGDVIFMLKLAFLYTLIDNVQKSTYLKLRNAVATETDALIRIQ